MLLFRSEEHIDEWREPRGVDRGATLTVEQQWELARRWYSNRMEPDWKRRTPAEAEAVFASVGLTGDFWRLSQD
jgi:hypothetical protein